MNLIIIFSYVKDSLILVFALSYELSASHGNKNRFIGRD